MTTKTATFHDLEGTSVYITGGGSGIGADITDGFMAQGAKVAFIGRSDASAFVEEMAANGQTDAVSATSDDGSFAGNRK